MKNNLLEQAKSLPIDEQIDLVEAIWDNIAEHGAVPQPTKEQEEELTRRLQAHLAHPERVMTFDEVTAAVTNSLRK